MQKTPALGLCILFLFFQAQIFLVLRVFCFHSLSVTQFSSFRLIFLLFFGLFDMMQVHRPTRVFILGFYDVLTSIDPRANLFWVSDTFSCYRPTPRSCIEHELGIQPFITYIGPTTAEKIHDKKRQKKKDRLTTIPKFVSSFPLYFLFLISYFLFLISYSNPLYTFHL